MRLLARPFGAIHCSSLLLLQSCDFALGKGYLRPRKTVRDGVRGALGRLRVGCRQLVIHLERADYAIIRLDKSADDLLVLDELAKMSDRGRTSAMCTYLNISDDLFADRLRLLETLLDARILLQAFLLRIHELESNEPDGHLA